MRRATTRSPSAVSAAAQVMEIAAKTFGWSPVMVETASSHEVVVMRGGGARGCPRIEVTRVKFPGSDHAATDNDQRNASGGRSGGAVMGI